MAVLATVLSVVLELVYGVDVELSGLTVLVYLLFVRRVCGLVGLRLLLCPGASLACGGRSHRKAGDLFFLDPTSSAGTVGKSLIFE